MQDTTHEELEVLRRRVAMLEESAKQQAEEHERAKQAYRESEERFRLFFDEAPVGKCMTAPDGALLRVNRAFAEMLGRTTEEMQSVSFAAITHPDDLPESKECVRCLLAGEKHTWAMEKRYVHKDGHLVWTWVTTRLQRNPDGSPRFFLTHIEDISDRKQVEIELRERIKELTCLQTIGRIVEEEGTKVERVLERSVAVLPSSWMHADCSVARIRLDDAEYRTGPIEDCVDLQRADIMVDGHARGAIEVGYLEKRPARDEGPFLGEERQLVDAIAERLGHVVERVEYEHSLHRERATLEAVFDGIEDVIYVADPETHELLHANASLEKLWGSDWRGKKCYRALQGRDAPCDFCTNDKIFGDNLGRSYVWETQNPVTGAWYRCSDKAIRWTDGRLVRFEIASDITALKEAQLLADQERRKVQTFLDNTVDVVTIVDSAGRYTYLNHAACRLFGRPAEELLGTSAFDAIHPEDREATQEAFSRWIEDGVESAGWENRLISGDGEVRDMLWTILPRFVDGELESVWSMARDVTASKQAHRALVASQEELEIHQEHLEKLVAARTAEIESANRELDQRKKVTDAINRVFRQALVCETEEEVAKTALQVAEELTGSKFGFIGELNAEGKLDTIGLSNPGWSACGIPGSQATTMIRGMPLRGIWAGVLKTGESMIIDDPASHPERVGTPDGHPPLTSFLGVPIKRESSAVGVIALANKPGGFTIEDQGAVEQLAGAFHEALVRKRAEIRLQEHATLKATQADLAVRTRGDLPAATLCQTILTFVCQKLDIPTGLLFAAGEDGVLHLAASHAHKRRNGEGAAFAPGEGLVGQAAAEGRMMVLEDVPERYFTIESGLGTIAPRTIVVKPVAVGDRVPVVLELGMLEAPDDAKLRMLDAVGDNIGYAIESARARDTQQRLLEHAQRLTEELQTQQEELKAANEELEEQTQRLKESEERLRAQQEELQVTNEELEEKNELLERQKKDVEQARKDLAEKAQELTLASKYKSEFLANMSHELRTPLNSLLLLSRSLADNKEGNLTPAQVEEAQVIHQGGNELLSLINEILDLSKIEAGRLELSLDAVRIADLAASARSGFQHVAEQQGLLFVTSVDRAAPEVITTDRKRLEQVIRNLVGNALKFTDKGSVELVFGAARPDAKLSRSGLDPRRAFSVTVKDTGIGIAPEQQKLIFEAFQQADGGTSRRYGGTGLGLSICREIVKLLGGEIQLSSRTGAGSVFTVYLPIDLSPERSSDRPSTMPEEGVQEQREPVRSKRVSAIPDDRDSIAPGDRTILLVEDDAKFAGILARQCRERGLKVLAAAAGEDGIELARQYGPAGVVLDLKLPGVDGWRVLETLKEDPATRHIPVHIVSVDEPSTHALRKGAVGYAQKPVDHQQIADALQRIDHAAAQAAKRVLVVDDDDDTRKGIVELIADEDVQVDAVDRGSAAREALRANRYDCMVLDLGLQDIDGGELLRDLEADESIEVPPVIVYTAKELTWEQNLSLRSYSESIIIKDVRSDERLLDEVSLFLHRVVAEMPEKKRQVITSLHDTNALLRGKKVLIVDDDMRTLFALTRILNERGMVALKAQNGAKAIEVLDQHPDVDVVLMDIMMPVVDGYEAMKRIRAQERFRRLPIIALTAKAMKGDQERCIRSGASDYLPKPIDQNRLVSMLRVWLYR